jgi:hypothetical protein
MCAARRWSASGVGGSAQHDVLSGRVAIALDMGAYELLQPPGGPDDGVAVEGCQGAGLPLWTRALGDHLALQHQQAMAQQLQAGLAAAGGRDDDRDTSWDAPYLVGGTSGRGEGGLPPRQHSGSVVARRVGSSTSQTWQQTALGLFGVGLLGSSGSLATMG